MGAMQIAQGRIISSLVVLGASGVLAAGCGGSSGSSGSSGAASGGGTSGSGAISKAQAIAYAHAVNLSAADVPGAIIGRAERESAAPSRESVEFAQCAGGVNPNRRVADTKSTTLKSGKGVTVTQVKSSVEVMPTAALAAANYAALRGGRGRGCLARLLPQALERTATSSAHFGPATVSVLENLLPAGQESFGVRVSTSISTIAGAKQVKLPVYFDMFALLAGPAEVQLSAFGISHPPSTATERRLLSVLYSRAQAHKL
jgi:hypothetical protein